MNNLNQDITISESEDPVDENNRKRYEIVSRLFKNEDFQKFIHEYTVVHPSNLSSYLVTHKAFGENEADIIDELRSVGRFNRFIKVCLSNNPEEVSDMDRAEAELEAEAEASEAEEG